MAVLGNFWEGITGKLADRWMSTAGPAAIFWLGVLLAWAYKHQGLGGLRDAAGWLGSQDSAVQLAVLIGALVGVTASGLVVSRLTLPVLRLAEGYWPSWLDAVRDELVTRRARRIKDLENRYQELAGKYTDASPRELREYVLLDEHMRRIPTREERRMPTRVGDILSSAEGEPFDKYGLDAVKCWPQLWLVLPESTRTELTGARASLDTATSAIVWGVLFCFCLAWAWWAPVVGFAVASAAYFIWLPDRAGAFADLLTATFDVHRGALYDALRWPRPDTPAQEKSFGEELTKYLWEGSDAPHPKFFSQKR